MTKRKIRKVKKVELKDFDDYWVDEFGILTTTKSGVEVEKKCSERGQYRIQVNKVAFTFTKWSIKSFAEMHNISYMTMNDLINRKTYGDVQ